MAILDLEEMVDLGMHFGHLKSHTHSKSKPYIFSVRNGVCVINLEKTQEKLKEAIGFVKKLSKDEKVILFIGAKRQLAGFIREKAEEIKMPYTNKRFIGGTLTNFSEMLKNISRLKKLIEKEKELETSKKKKELRMITKERQKSEILLGGLVLLTKLPDALFIVDAAFDKNAVLEANGLGIPVIAIADTNADPSKIDYPIPANDDSVKGVKYIISEIVEAYKEGKKTETKKKSTKKEKVKKR